MHFADSFEIREQIPCEKCTSSISKRWQKLTSSVDTNQTSILSHFNLKIDTLETYKREHFSASLIWLLYFFSCKVAFSIAIHVQTMTSKSSSKFIFVIRLNSLTQLEMLWFVVEISNVVINIRIYLFGWFDPNQKIGRIHPKGSHLNRFRT